GFDYSEFGGLARATEMCSGLGACRKKLDGTMCPSYMATLEEKHSTRGRANALRLAIAGTLGPFSLSDDGARREEVSRSTTVRTAQGEAGLGDADVFEVLDLCLECRACKAECPVGVDIARFKSEFLADYYRRHGTPLSARAIGHIHALSKFGSAFAPLSNVVAGSSVGRWLNEQLLGIDRRRPL